MLGRNMKRSIPLLLSALICLTACPSWLSADTLPTDSTLLYEYWPTLNGIDAGYLTFSSMNGNVYNPSFAFTSTSTIKIHAVCLAIDSYGGVEPNLKLGVYKLLDNKTVKDLIGYSDPYPFNGQTIDWYFSGDVTCFHFSTPPTLYSGAKYAIGVNRSNNATTNEDIIWFNRDAVNDPDVWMGSSSFFPGAVIPTDDKPYVRIYGEIAPLDPVIIIPGILGSWEKDGRWVIDPLLHTYDNLVDTLVANGYIKDQTVFTFPYDWEQPNEVTAFQLKNKIADVKATCNCSKVDLIGHSMGGLVAANYIQRDDYGYDVDQLFLVATPLSGAPKAYKTWEGGEVDFGKPIVNAFVKIIFQIKALKNGFNSIFSYVHNKPVVSVQELLPVRTDYLKIGDIVLAYPQNGFLEDLLRNFSKINFRGVTINTILADTKDNSTIGGFSIASSSKLGLWAYGQPVSTTFVAGDGTVPRSSIESVVSINKEFEFVDHTDIVSISKSYIYEQLTGKNLETSVNKIYSPVTSFLILYLLSPIDMQITAPDGKKLGKEFESNSEISQIPEAFYSGFGTDNEYAIIPNPLPGEYKVETIGTGSGGRYTVVANYSDLSTSSEIMVTGTSTPNMVIPHTFIISSTSTVISLLLPPVATSTPTTTPITPDTCVTDITQAYKDKWISKKVVYERLVADCKVLKELFKARDNAKTKLALSVINTAIKFILADMDLLAMDKGNTKDAVLLITKITTWFRTHELQ
jgi:pimeloyl-ACP methyl ester carboxylesterase